ncbi:ornithine cyclodeaminase family protein [bacterium]|nr:ornithine cyclodeaminase family protein [bacterium]
MTRIIEKHEIAALLQDVDVIGAMEEGFRAYSAGQVLVPPVAEMLFDDPPGEVHIKYGCITGDDVYAVKIASGFPGNTGRGLPTGNGIVLLFDRATGAVKAVFLDEGLLTDIRTAAAGALAGRYFAPRAVRRIGICGAGTQGRLQLEQLKQVTDCRDVLIYDHHRENSGRFQREMTQKGYRVAAVEAPAEMAAACNLIVTATPATVPLFRQGDIKPGTHITAVGSDTPRKNELAPALLAEADRIAVDSMEQARYRGEVYRAVKEGVLDASRVRELGYLAGHPGERRGHADEITVADLTGVAVQDIQIAKAVFSRIDT